VASERSVSMPLRRCRAGRDRGCSRAHAPNHQRVRSTPIAIDDSSGRNPSGNPAITDVEAAHVGVRAEFDLNAVELEVTNQNGAGFRTLLG
jgi:hypothetical protein